MQDAWEIQAVLKTNGKDTYLQSVQQNGAPVLQETSNRDEATKFKVTFDKDLRFQLTDLPGGSTFEKISNDGKTYLRTSNGKYVKLGRGRVEETENIDQCLEVDIPEDASDPEYIDADEMHTVVQGYLHSIGAPMWERDNPKLHSKQWPVFWCGFSWTRGTRPEMDDFIEHMCKSGDMCYDLEHPNSPLGKLLRRLNFGTAGSMFRQCHDTKEDAKFWAIVSLLFATKHSSDQ